MLRLVCLGLALVALLGAGPAVPESGTSAPLAASTPASSLPERLSETGLFVTGSTRVRAENLPFAPQYPLWSDGAAKRRWLYLPPGTAIDASQADAWEFPPGTRLWKAFSHGRPIETRFIERLEDGSWRYATYVWNADASEALLAPSEGVTLAIDGVPGGRYVIPSQDDCRACHEGTPVPALGVSALQLSPDRDPGAPNGEPHSPDQVDLPALAERGLLRKLPAALLETAPRIGASSPTARAALGYLHANCGHCHNNRGPLADVGLTLEQASADVASVGRMLRSTIGHPADTRAFGLTTRVVPGRPADSQLVARMRSRDPLTQMPPLGTGLIDSEGLALVEQWIQQLDLKQEHMQ
jgi:hypothetical protein